jgi:hypothetical protein
MFKIMGMDYSNGNVESIEMHESDTVEEANSWVVGYVRGGDWGGWEAINVVAPNGFTKAEYSKDYGWTHY